MSLKWTLLLITVFCVYANLCEFQHNNYNKIWNLEGTGKIKLGQSFLSEDNSFLYAFCNENKLHGPELKCNFIIERRHRDGREPEKETCEVHLIGHEDGHYRPELVARIERFADHRALISWIEISKDKKDGNGRISLLNVRNCTVTHLNFQMDKSWRFCPIPSVVVYNETFDIFLTDKELCGGPSCRITYNVDGNKISAPKPFPSEFSNLFTIPNNKSFYVLTEVDVDPFPIMELSKVNSDGDVKVLTTVTGYYHSIRKFSNSNGKYSMCQEENNRKTREILRCLQYLNDQLIMNATTSDIGGEIAIYNLAKDGILLVNLNCQELNIFTSCNSYKILEIFRNGDQRELVHVNDTGFECPSNLISMEMGVFEKDDYFCITFTCHGRELFNKSDSIHFGMNCISKRKIGL